MQALVVESNKEATEWKRGSLKVQNPSGNDVWFAHQKPSKTLVRRDPGTSPINFSFFCCGLSLASIEFWGSSKFPLLGDYFFRPFYPSTISLPFEISRKSGVSGNHSFFSGILSDVLSELRRLFKIPSEKSKIPSGKRTNPPSFGHSPSKTAKRSRNSGVTRTIGKINFKLGGITSENWKNGETFRKSQIEKYKFRPNFKIQILQFDFKIRSKYAGKQLGFLQI